MWIHVVYLHIYHHRIIGLWGSLWPNQALCVCGCTKWDYQYYLCAIDVEHHFVHIVFPICWKFSPRRVLPWALLSRAFLIVFGQPRFPTMMLRSRGDCVVSFFSAWWLHYVLLLPAMVLCP